MNKLMETNMYNISETLIIIGSCLESMQPESLSKLKKISNNILTLCLEETHINMAITKISAMLSTNKVKNIIFASVDKSPHCVQLHYIGHELKRIMDLKDIDIKNYVVVDNELIEISPKTISLSKNLSKLESLNKEP